MFLRLFAALGPVSQKAGTKSKGPRYATPRARDAAAKAAFVKSQTMDGRSGLPWPGMATLCSRSDEAAIMDDRTRKYRTPAPGSAAAWPVRAADPDPRS